MSALPPPTDESYDRHTRWRFSLRSVWLVTTVLCIVIGVPGVFVVATWLTAWVLPAVILIGVLVALQVPGYLLLKCHIDEKAGADENGKQPTQNREQVE